MARDKSRRKFDSKKLKERTKESQKRAKAGGKNILDNSKDLPKIVFREGKHTFDIIPYITGKNDSEPNEWAYTFEYYMHRNIGTAKIPVICPQATFGEPCPICEHQQKLRDKGDESYKDYWPKRRNLYNIICYDRGEQEKGIQLLDVSWHYMEKYLATISEKTNRKTGKLETISFADTDKRKGRSIEFTLEAAKSENDYPDWRGHNFDRRDYDIKDSILEKALVLDKCVVLMSYDELEELHFNGPKGKNNSDDDDKPESVSDDLDDLKDDLEDIDDFKDLKEFIKNNDLDIKVKKADWKDDEDDAKDEVRVVLEKKFDGNAADDDDDDDDDKKDKHTEKEIEKMSFKKLKKLIKDEDLDIDMDDYEKDDDDDLEDLREEVVDKLDL